MFNLCLVCVHQARFVSESRKFVLAGQDTQAVNDVDDLISCIMETLVTVFPAISKYIY